MSEIITDALDLCLQVLNSDKPNCVIARGSNKWPGVDFFFNKLETPTLLQKEGILRIDEVKTKIKRRMGDLPAGERWFMSSSRGKTLEQPKELYAVLFDLKRTKEWSDKEIKKRLGMTFIGSGKLPKGWLWIDKNKGSYQFGELGVFTQMGKRRKKVFQQLMGVLSKNPDGFHIQSLSKRTKLKPELLYIEISGINKRLRKEIGLEFKGDGKGVHKLQITSS